MDHDAPECLSCGACCFSTNPTAVRVRGDDHTRLGEALTARFTTFVDHRCYMRVEDGHCAALEVRADGTFACLVYDARPDVCRQLARGSAACNGERWEKVHRTVEALARLRVR
jgi:Fe-S-cluster containining protein